MGVVGQDRGWVGWDSIGVGGVAQHGMGGEVQHGVGGVHGTVWGWVVQAA